jgi:hypothetical protein
MSDGIEESAVEKIQIEKQSLAGRLRTLRDEWERDLQTIKEDGFLNRLRAYNRKDEETRTAVDNEPEWRRDRTYVGLTRTKVQAAYSRLVDAEFPGGTRKNWSVAPTPEADLALPPDKQPPNPMTPEVAQALEEIAAENPQEAMAYEKEIQRQFIENRNKAIQEEAVSRAKLMERRIEDQLVEENFDVKYRDARLETVILGEGCISGPKVGIKTSRNWVYQRDEMGGGQWVVSQTEKVAPLVAQPSMFRLTWEPDAKNPEDMSGLFEQHLLTRADFRALGNAENFDKEAVDRLISDNPDGNHIRTSIDIELQSIGNLDNLSGSKRYEVFEYWGVLDRKDFEEAGVTFDGPEANVNIWFCGDEVLMAQLNPLVPQIIPYHFFPFEKSPNGLVGCGVPEQMEDSQYLTNKFTRNMVDNADLTSGPMVEFNTDFMDPTKPLSQQIKPWTLLLRSGGDPANPAIRTYDMPSRLNELLAILQHIRRNIDDETNIPSYFQGQGNPQGSGVHRTSSGMSMLMGAASINIKSIIKNADDYFWRPFIQAMYDFNMQWGNPEIKGDMKIKAMGVASLIAKEIQQQAIMTFLQTTANPLDAPLTNRDYLLSQAAEVMDMDAEKVLKSKEEVAQAQQDPLQQLQAGTMQAQIAETQARVKKIEAETIKLMQGSEYTEQEIVAELQKKLAEIEHIYAQTFQIQEGVEYDKRQQVIDVAKIDSNNNKNRNQRDDLRSTNVRR